jgi:hypothetical protein
MAKRRSSRIELSLSTGEDPTLWRYNSLAEALQANTAVLGALIAAGQPKPELPIEQESVSQQVSRKEKV